ncbi:MAG: MFS transporter [Acidimicrobiales bacterium]
MSERRGLQAAWVVVSLVMASAATAQSFGRFTYGVVLPDIRADLLDGSNSIAGALGTVNVAAYLIGTFAVSAVSSRLNQVDLIRIGMVLSTGGLFVASFATNAWLLGLTLFSMGFGGAMIWIPSPRVGAMALSEKRRGLGVGLVGSGIGMGIVAAGWLATLMGNRYGTDSWRMVYRVEAIFGLVVLALGSVVFRTGESTTGTSGGFGGFGALATIPGWKALTGAYACYGFFYLLVIGYLVARLEDDVGFSEARASAMFSLIGLGATFGGLLLGPLSDRIGRRQTMMWGFATFAGAIGAILTGQELIVAVGSLVVGLMFAGVPSTIAAYIVDTTSPERYGQAYAAATLAFGGAQAISPQIGGLIADLSGSFTLVFVVALVMAMLAAGVSSLLPTDPPRPADARP